jgi:aminopeptidase N
MKNIYLLLLLATSLANARQPRSYALAGKQTAPDISQFERQYYQRLGEAGQAGTTAAFTVASDNFDISYYRCHWKLNPAVRYINGTITSLFTTKTNSDSVVFDLVSSLTVDSVIYHNSKITFRQTTDNDLIIKWPATINANRTDSVSIFYQGVPVTYGLGNFFQGSYLGNYAIFTLSEPYGAAGWWPCKNGLNDKADSLDISITVPDTYMPSSNGLLVNQVTGSGSTTGFFKHRYPIATYLVAVAVTNYVLTKDSVLLGNRQMPVLMYAPPIVVDYFKPATAVAKKCLVKFSELFGPYPFEKEQYAQTAWAIGGGMEHQTNSFISDIWPNLVAHELGHQWFGDKVTCGSWQDLWLNEGFASFAENLYYELFESPATFYTGVNNLIKNVTSVPNGALFVADTTNYSTLFSKRLTYNKGCLVVRMLRWKLGDSTFFSGLRTYTEDPAVKFGYARTADLKRAMEKISNKNLSTFFNKWVYGEGYPSYKLTWSQNANLWAKIKLAQTTSHTSVSFFDMPVAVQFKNATRDTTVILDHQYSGQEFSVNIGFKADTVLIDPKLWLISKENSTLKETNDQSVNQLKIYPNPSPEKLFISLNNPTDTRMNLQLFNSIGQLVYSKEITLPGRNELLEIPVQHFARGIYYLRLKSTVFNITRKIMR